jgi:hypothetical protein
MLGKSLLLLGLIFTLARALAAQDEALKLPEGLSETETRQIQKEQGPKSHVEAAVKVAEARLNQALVHTQGEQYREAAQALGVYGALFTYADAHARRLPASARKELHKCLKVIEQGIFKQNRVLEAVRRELPFNYREETEPLVETLKRLRLRAINDMLGGGEIIK